eukprot:5380728-Amphidinium_carterae.2
MKTALLLASNPFPVKICPVGSCRCALLCVVHGTATMNECCSAHVASVTKTHLARSAFKLAEGASGIPALRCRPMFGSAVALGFVGVSFLMLGAEENCLLPTVSEI